MFATHGEEEGVDDGKQADERCNDGQGQSEEEQQQY